MKIFILLFLFIGCVPEEQVKVVSGPGELSVSSSVASNAFLGKALSTTTIDTIIFRNTGGLPLTNLNFSLFSEESPFQYEAGFAPDSNGSCLQGQDLKPNESCSVKISYRPIVEGAWNVPLSISYNDGVFDKTTEHPLNGYAGVVANLEVPSELELSLGVLEIGGVRDFIIPIRNIGGLSAIDLNPDLSGDGDIEFKGGVYPGLGGNCTSSLAANSTCSIVVRFSPVTNKSHTKFVSISYETGLGPNTLTINLSAVSAVIQGNLLLLGGALGSTKDFGKVTIGNSATHVFTLLNAGYLATTNLSFTIPAPYSLVSHTCGTTLEISGVCEVTIAFTPIMKVTSSAVLQANYNNGNFDTFAQATVDGQGQLPAHLIFKDGTPITTFNFGPTAVNGVKKKSLIVTNIGDVPASGTTLESTSAPYTGSSSCPAQLLPTQNCILEISVSPQALGPVASKDIVFKYNNGVIGTQESRLPLSATGTSLGFLKFGDADPQHDFGSVFLTSLSAPRLIQIQNVGLAPAFNITFGFTAPYKYSGNVVPGINGTCPAAPTFTLAAGSTCTVELVYEPVSTLFSFEYFTVDYEDGSTVADQMKFSFYGTGQEPGELNFTVPNNWVAGTFANGVDHVIVILIDNVGSIPAEDVSGMLGNGLEWSFFGGTYPGINPTGTPLTLCETTVASNCAVVLRYRPLSSGTHNESLTMQYNSGAGIVTSTLNFSANGMDLGYLDEVPATVIPGAVVGGLFQEENVVVRNIGSGPMNALSMSGFGGGFTQNMAGTTCTATLAAGASCNMRIRYTGATPIGLKSRMLTIEYNDGFQLVTKSFEVTSSSLQPAELTITDAPLYDYGIVAVSASKDRSFSITNTKAGPAGSLSLTGLAAPFTIQSTNCGATLNGNSSCNVTVRFSPTVVGTQHMDTLNVGYNNQVSVQNTPRNLTGIGESPPSNHGGWSEIFAIGNKVNISNVSSSDKMVRLRWNDMIPTSGVITGYNVYRSLTTTFDLTQPIATNITTSSKTFIDSTINSGTVYYYTVRPIIMGFPSRVLSSFGVIRVVAPFDNMTLVHRWMANQDICQKLGSTPNRNNDHKCAYSGLANTAGSYDLGHDLLVDRYELGSDLTSRAGQTPRSTLTQQGAKLACELQSNLNLIGSGNVSKRILSRKEWMATASWPSGLTDAQITTTEEGILNSADCNGNSSQLDEAGNNTNCRSRYGSENHAGNAWEWVSDRVFNGTGVSLNSQRLIQSNTDLDGVNFGSLGTQLVETLPCLNLVTGLVENYSSGVTCPSSSVNLAAQTTVYSHNDYHISPGPAGGRQLLVGGSFQPTSNSGLFTNAWVSSTFNGGGVRCGIQVSY